MNKRLITLSAAVFSACCATTAMAQAPAQQPMFATTKVDGTDNVYIFRYQNHQAMFVVTPAGVIVTDPISYGRPQAAKTYLDEIRKITKAPIKYLIYSHHHYDHIAGGKVFKEVPLSRDQQIEERRQLPPMQLEAAGMPLAVTVIAV